MLTDSCGETYAPSLSSSATLGSEVSVGSAVTIVKNSPLNPESFTPADIVAPASPPKNILLNLRFVRNIPSILRVPATYSLSIHCQSIPNLSPGS